MDFLEKIKDLLSPFDEAFKIAGIAGLGLCVLLYVFREIIQKSIFPTLTKLHAYKVIKLIIICTFSIAIVCIVAFVYISTNSPIDHKKQGEVKFQELKLEDKGVILVDSVKKRK